MLLVVVRIGGNALYLGLIHGPMHKTKAIKTVQGLLAVGSGGFLGEGFMQGTSKYFYLPEAHTDFAFAVWAQEMGVPWGCICCYLGSSFHLLWIPNCQ